MNDHLFSASPGCAGIAAVYRRAASLLAVVGYFVLPFDSGNQVFAAEVPEPTEANVPYGKHERQVVDFYRAESAEPTPVILYIHGGGWGAGSKDTIAGWKFDGYLKQGISVVSVEYRFIRHATADGETPPVKGTLHDAARALQFVRSKAAEWNIDKARIAATGASAGACSSLWLAFHDDLADTDSEDPISRESTRLFCAAALNAQTTLDPRQMREWTPNSVYGGRAFGYRNKTNTVEGFEDFLNARDEILPWIKEFSPFELVTEDDPKVGLFYRSTPAMGKDQKDPTHTANFGVGLHAQCKVKGVESHFVYPGAENVEYTSLSQFLIAELKK